MGTAKRAAGVRPYVREFKSGDRWWWVALPGRQRKALNVREAEATYDDALRLACERYVDGSREVAPGETVKSADVLVLRARSKVLEMRRFYSPGDSDFRAGVKEACDAIGEALDMAPAPKPRPA